MSKAKIAKRFIKAFKSAHKYPKTPTRKNIEKEMGYWVEEYNKAAKKKSESAMRDFRRRLSTEASQETIAEVNKRDIKIGAGVAGGTMAGSAGLEYLRKTKESRERRKKSKILREAERRRRISKRKAADQWFSPEYIKRRDKKRKKFLERRKKQRMDKLEKIKKKYRSYFPDKEFYKK